MPVSRIQRAFLIWLDETQPRLLRQVIVQRRTKRKIEFVFDVGAPVLNGWLNSYEITVAVTIGDECWDLIYDDHALPTPAAGGFVCRACEPDARIVHPNREALWRDHLFAPFAEWINERLAPSTGLAISGQPKSWTAARLIQPDDPLRDAHDVIPLNPSPLPRPRRLPFFRRRS